MGDSSGCGSPCCAARSLAMAAFAAGVMPPGGCLAGLGLQGMQNQTTVCIRGLSAWMMRNGTLASPAGKCWRTLPAPPLLCILSPAETETGTGTEM